MYLLVPRPRSINPSLNLWKSNTKVRDIQIHFLNTNNLSFFLPKCARSEINNRSFQSVTPRDSFFCISSTNSGRLTTQPLPKHASLYLPFTNFSQSSLPMIFTQFWRWKPDGSIWKSYSTPSTTTLCPALLPPYRNWIIPRNCSTELSVMIYLTTTDNISFRCQ